MNGNRWGLKGSEDLGNGTSAIFVLESGFDLLMVSQSKVVAMRQLIVSLVTLFLTAMTVSSNMCLRTSVGLSLV